MTNRRLKARINEHKTNDNRDSFLADHVINYSNPKILARDNNSFRLQIKETLKIKEYCAHNSLNGNLGSLKFSKDEFIYNCVVVSFSDYVMI